MNFKSGDRVKKGDIVAVIEQSDLEQNLYFQVEQAQGALSNADTAFAVCRKKDIARILRHINLAVGNEV